MKIFVTGGGGFIGSHLVDKLISLNHKVVVIDNFKNNNLDFRNEGAEYFVSNFADNKVEDLFKREKPEIVFHLAAQISVTNSIKNPVFDAENNIINSVKLLDWSQKYGVKKIIFASSGGAIYGERSDLPTKEIFDAKPISPYGIGKQVFEYYLQASDIQNVVLRFSNVYGPRQQPEGEAGVVSIFLNKIMNDESPVIFGDGKSTRDYVFVQDVVSAFIKTLEKDVEGVHNISTGKETSVLELWNYLAKIGEVDFKPKFVEARTGEIQRSCLSYEKAKERMFWRPQISLEEGLRKTYEWFFKTYK